MAHSDADIAFEAAQKKLAATLEEMSRGALDGCDPTWAAHLAASVHEAITAINSGIKAWESVND